MITAENTSELICTLSNETRETKISTCCCRSVIIRFPKDGSTDQQCAEAPEEHMMNVPIAEVYETLVTKGKNELETIPMEALD